MKNLLATGVEDQLFYRLTTTETYAPTVLSKKSLGVDVLLFDGPDILEGRITLHSYGTPIKVNALKWILHFTGVLNIEGKGPMLFAGVAEQWEDGREYAHLLIYTEISATATALLHRQVDKLLEKQTKFVM